MAERTENEVRDDRARINESVQDALAVAGSLGGSDRAAALGAVVSAVITSKSLGGLLKRLFGVSNRDIPYALQTSTYPILTTATVGVPTSSDVNVTQDSDFYAQRMAITSGNDGTGTFDFLFNLRFNSKDMRFASNANGGHVLGYQGTGQRPFVWPQPLYLPRNQTVTIILTQLVAAQRTVFVDLIGRKTVDVASLQLTQRRW